jgi:hypothetical protein
VGRLGFGSLKRLLCVYSMPWAIRRALLGGCNPGRNGAGWGKSARHKCFIDHR